MTTLRARFDDYPMFVDGLRALKDARISGYTAYGPTNLKEVEDLMPSKGSRVRGWATAGAIFGLVLFWVMCVTTSLIYDIYVGGKPPVSNVPYVIPAYEGTILVGSISAFVAALIYAALGFHATPRDYDPRFSEDNYGIEVTCDAACPRVLELLNSAGAVEVTQS